MESRLDQVVRVVEEMFGCEAKPLAPHSHSGLVCLRTSEYMICEKRM
jgi:hypothetical protein